MLSTAPPVPVVYRCDFNDVQVKNPPINVQMNRYLTKNVSCGTLNQPLFRQMSPLLTFIAALFLHNLSTLRQYKKHILHTF